MKSKKLEFEKLYNTRDLGGLPTKFGGKIKPNKLIRSGLLWKATESDILKLTNLLDLVVDFRTQKELTEKPDPAIKDIKFIHLPILSEKTAGITKEKSATVSLVKSFAYNPVGAKNYMVDTYKNFVTDSLPLSNYKKFIELLLKDYKKAVLWHCTAGKDRAGFGAIIIQNILGVDKDSIYEDYLYTNDCSKEEIKQITLNMINKHEIDTKDIQKSLMFQGTIDSFFGAKEEYINAAYEKINESYGDFDNFIKNGLKISSEQIEKLRDIYLE